MSALNPRAMALQGIGYGVLFVALQGVSPMVDVKRLYGGGGGRPEHAQRQHVEDIEHSIHQQILDEDEIFVMAVANLIVNGAFT